MEDIVFEISNWGRSRNGMGGTRHYITSSKEYFFNNEKVKTISDDEYDKVIKFIQEKLLGHNYEEQTIFDAGYKVRAFYQNEEICVSNFIPLYNDANLLFKAISGQDVTTDDINRVENEYKSYYYDYEKNEIIEKSIFYIKKRKAGINYEESLKFVTNDKLLYTANCYENRENGSFSSATYEIKKIRSLSDDEYNKIVEYIQNNILGKEYEYEKIIDSIQYAVFVSYNDNKINSPNNLKLYEDCDRFLSEQIKFD